MNRLFVFLGFLVAFAASPVSASTSRILASPWLFVSDVHLDPLDKHSQPRGRGHDTNEAMLVSALAEMKRVDPAPPVIVMPGDFLGHSFDDRNVKTTIAHIAQSFRRTFPQGQFVLALGNEDSGCGDYDAGPNAQFLRDTATAWEPLVNRRGAAPGFRRTFSSDGFYTTKLPLSGVRAVVLDDVFWSPRFRPGCATTNVDGSAEQLADLDRALPPGSRDKTWVVFHIPPGVDVFTTIHVLHRLAVVPFLNAVPRNRLLSMLADKRRNVSLVVAGHTHKFAFRLIDRRGADPIPALPVPALSGILQNNPMFLTVQVGAGGTIGKIEDYAYDRDGWHDIGGTKTSACPISPAPPYRHFAVCSRPTTVCAPSSCASTMAALRRRSANGTGVGIGAR